MELYKGIDESELNYEQKYAKQYFSIEENKNNLYKLNKGNYQRHREEYLQHKKEKFQEMKMNDPIKYEAYKAKRREEYHKKKEKKLNK